MIYLYYKSNTTYFDIRIKIKKVFKKTENKYRSYIDFKTMN